MRELIKELNFDFMGKRNIWLAVSAVVFVLSITTLVVRGINFGIDFTGGTLIELGYAKPVELGDVRGALEKGGFPGAIVQHFGTAQDVMVRIPPRDSQNTADISTQVVSILNSGTDNTVTLRRQEFVGPQVGDELAQDGLLAMVWAMIAIGIYVALRFEKRFAVGAIAAVAHDPLIILGLFSLFQWEFDLSVMAAVLAVIGYSLNDTVVVFDRIRENFRKMRKGTPVEIANRSINQTLSRTIITSLTTLLVVIALFVFGGPVIHNFALALIIGIVVGTYSSIYVASTIALLLGVSKADLMPVEKEGADAKTLP